MIKCAECGNPAQFRDIDNDYIAFCVSCIIEGFPPLPNCPLYTYVDGKRAVVSTIVLEN